MFGLDSLIFIKYHKIIEYALPFLCIVFLFCVKLFAQHAVIVGYTKYRIDYNDHKGYLILNNGEKVDGDFKYAMDEFPTYSLKLLSPAKKNINRYSVKEINRLVLSGSDTSLSNRDSTYFETFEKHKLFYRQLTFGDIRIYDERFFNVNESKGVVYTLLTIIYQGRTYKLNNSKALQSLLYSFGMSQFATVNKLSLPDIIRNLNGLLKIKN
jgi:hypothetical protein